MGQKTKPTPMRPPKTEFGTLTLRDDTTSNTPAIVRLRAAMKALLRQWGLRCTAITEDRTEEAATTTSSEAKA